MPRVRVLRLLSMALHRTGTTFAYLSWFAHVVKLHRLPGKPGDEPSVSGIIIVPAGTQLTL
jgi:hypothetical protein